MEYIFSGDGMRLSRHWKNLSLHNMQKSSHFFIFLAAFQEKYSIPTVFPRYPRGSHSAYE
ncbi:hypothetical protein LDL36_06680 [Komagataeibacter sp. FNDCR1]|nr:hypothetical protein [Komagataeibacter sp. FNDCR1]